MVEIDFSMDKGVMCRVGVIMCLCHGIVREGGAGGDGVTRKKEERCGGKRSMHDGEAGVRHKLCNLRTLSQVRRDMMKSLMYMVYVDSGQSVAAVAAHLLPGTPNFNLSTLLRLLKRQLKLKLATHPCEPQPHILILSPAQPYRLTRRQRQKLLRIARLIKSGSEDKQNKHHQLYT